MSTSTYFCTELGNYHFLVVKKVLHLYSVAMLNSIQKVRQLVTCHLLILKCQPFRVSTALYHTNRTI